MTRFLRSLAIAFVGASLVGTPALAQDNGDDAQSENNAEQPAPPQEVAQKTVDTLLARLQENRETYKQDPEALYAMIEEVLVPRVDIEEMSKLVLGRHWRSASEEQRERFSQAFKQMVIQTYGNALYGFDKEKIEYQPVRADDDAEDITFRANVITDNGDKVPVTLDMHLVDGNWKVYNGTVGNLSFVTNYRGQFNAQIKSGGLDAVIEKLEQRYGVGPASNGNSDS